MHLLPIKTKLWVFWWTQSLVSEKNILHNKNNLRLTANHRWQLEMWCHADRGSCKLLFWKYHSKCPITLSIASIKSCMWISKEMQWGCIFRAARFIKVIVPRWRWPHGGKTNNHKSLKSWKLKDLITRIKLWLSLYASLKGLLCFIQCCRLSLMHNWIILEWPRTS